MNDIRRDLLKYELFCTAVAVTSLTLIWAFGGPDKVAWFICTLAIYAAFVAFQVAARKDIARIEQCIERLSGR